MKIGSSKLAPTTAPLFTKRRFGKCLPGNTGAFPTTNFEELTIHLVVFAIVSLGTLSLQKHQQLQVPQFYISLYESCSINTCIS